MTPPICRHTIGQQQAEPGAEQRPRSNDESKCREIQHNLLHSDLTMTTQLGFVTDYFDAGLMPQSNIALR